MKLIKELKLIKPNKITLMKQLPLIITILVLLSSLAIGIADPTTGPPPRP